MATLAPAALAREIPLKRSLYLAEQLVDLLFVTQLWMWTLIPQSYIHVYTTSEP
jgi:hypothetical protein